jgi:hypothetical protein
MRLAHVTLAGALATVVLALPSPASAVTPWDEVSRTAYFTVTSTNHGPLKGHQGNWHTAWMQLNGPAGGVSGVVADWTCDRGVKPNYQQSSGPWTCTVESLKLIKDAFDDQGDSQLLVKLNKQTRRVRAVGTVAVTNAKGKVRSGTLDLEGLAAGTRVRSISESADGLTRQVYAERGKTSATGKILNVRLTATAFKTRTSKLASLTLYVKKS